MISSCYQPRYIGGQFISEISAELAGFLGKRCLEEKAEQAQFRALAVRPKPLRLQASSRTHDQLALQDYALLLEFSGLSQTHHAKRQRQCCSDLN